MAFEDRDDQDIAVEEPTAAGLSRSSRLAGSTTTTSPTCGLAADFDNYRKRVRASSRAWSRAPNERLLNELLPVLDDLERALVAAEQHEEAKLEEGVRLVHRQLAEVLRKEGLAEIETEGAFDPHVHEALLEPPAEAESRRHPGAPEGLPPGRPRPAAGRVIVAE